MAKWVGSDDGTTLGNERSCLGTVVKYASQIAVSRVGEARCSFIIIRRLYYYFRCFPLVKKRDLSGKSGVYV